MATAEVSTPLKLTPLVHPPASASKGTVYMDDTTNKLMVYDSTTWQACW